MTPWTEREIERFTKRVGLFRRRGRPDAEQIAERLVERDRDRDERRLCVECSQFQQDGGCFAGKTYDADPLAPVRSPITDLLQRCSGFTWQTP